MRGLARFAVAGALVAACFTTDDLLVQAADAVVGRPLTPVSVAGVARRTTRRVIRRTTMYVPALPPSGCQTVVIEGTTLSQCGSTYYQASGSQYVVVVIE